MLRYVDTESPNIWAKKKVIVPLILEFTTNARRQVAVRALRLPRGARCAAPAATRCGQRSGAPSTAASRVQDCVYSAVDRIGLPRLGALLLRLVQPV